MTTPNTISARRITFTEALDLADLFTDLGSVQHPEYALEAAIRVGSSCEFFGFFLGDEAAGYASVRVKKIPFIGGGLAYCYEGPATARAGSDFDPALWPACLALLADEYAERGKIFRVCAPFGLGGNKEDADCYRHLGFHPSKQDPGRTILIDLAPSLDDLRAKLKGKWRTDLNRADRSGLEMRRTTDPDAYVAVQGLLDQLSEKKGFAVKQDVEFFAAAARHTAPERRTTPDARNNIVAHLVYADDTLVGGHIGSYTTGRALYLLGAITPAGRDLRASFALQWAAIEYARSRGIATYDLGGIDTQANPDVYRFKSRMGGEEVDREDWWERDGGWLATRIVKTIEKLKAAR